MFCVCEGRLRSCGWCSSGWISAPLAWWAGERDQLSSRNSQTNVSQDAVLFLDHVVVSVDGLLTVRLILSSSYLTVCYVSLKPVEIISMWPFSRTSCRGCEVGVCLEWRETHEAVSRSLSSHDTMDRHQVTRHLVSRFHSEIVRSPGLIVRFEL